MKVYLHQTTKASKHILDNSEGNVSKLLMSKRIDI